VKFAAGAKAGTQKITVVSTDKGISKDDAVKALGKKSKTYVVKTWTEPAADKG
jgi:hypothetical protein